MTLPIEHPSGLTIRQPDMSLARPTRWAWQHRIAVGYLNLLVGDEGIGKGVLAAWLIARLTHGDLPGNFRHEPVMVGIVADEDSFNDVWTPRLYAANADLAFVRHIEHPQEGYLNLSNDREALEIAVDLDGFKVVYFDQLLDNLDALVDEYKQKAVRHALRPLRRIGRDFDIAVLAGLHPNKRAGSFRELVAGTVAFNAVSRSSLLMAAHPDDPDRRVICRGKGNLSKTPSALDFEIESHVFQANARDFDVPLAVDFQESLLTVDDLIRRAAEPPPAGEARTAARDLIAAALADGEWHAASPILTECAEQEVHERAARRAAHDIGIDQERRGFPAVSWWRLAQSGHTPASAYEVSGVSGVSGVEKLAPDDSPDSEASGDTQNTRRTGVRSVNPDAELARLTAKFGHNGNGGGPPTCRCERPIKDDGSCAKCGHRMAGAFEATS
jgi:AAA domain